MGLFLDILFHLSIFLFIHQYQWFLESGNVNSLTLFFLKIVLAVLGPFLFCIRFRISLPLPTPTCKRKACWDFDWDGIESVGQQGKNRHFNNTEFFLSVNMVLFRSSVIYLRNVLRFQCGSLGYFLMFLLLLWMIAFQILFSSCCSYIEIEMIFLYWPCVLWRC